MATKRAILLLSVLAFGFGCNSAASTGKFYTPVTPMKYAAKPANYTVPIIDKYPSRRPYTVIGRLAFNAVESAKYMCESIQYNARKNGADLVVLTQWDSANELQPFFIPGYTTYSPMTTYSSGNFSGHTQGGYQRYSTNTTGYYSGSSTTQVPIYHPGYSGVMTVTRIHISCDMIVLEDKDTYGYLGVILEEVKNADQIRIASVWPDSAAAKAGLRVGDVVMAVGSYECKAGLANYFERGPTLRVGEPIELALLRGQEEITITVVPQRGIY